MLAEEGSGKVKTTDANTGEEANPAAPRGMLLRKERRSPQLQHSVNYGIPVLLGAILKTRGMEVGFGYKIYSILLCIHI